MKIPQDVCDFIDAIENNDPSVVEKLRALDLSTTDIPLVMVVNLRHREALNYALSTPYADTLLRVAATTEWFEALDLIVPLATPQGIDTAASLCAGNNKIDALKYLSHFNPDLSKCVFPACFSRSQDVLTFLLERGVAQKIRDEYKDISPNNDPYNWSFTYGQKIWPALDFLREQTQRWILDNATQNTGLSKVKKI